MSAPARERIRLLPVVIAVAGGLMLLKLTGLVFQGGYVLAPSAGAPAKPFGRILSDARRDPEWAQDITGSVPPKKEEAPPKPEAGKAGDKTGDAAAGKPKGPPGDKAPATPANAEPAKSAPVGAEREVLEKLGARRQQLDERRQELDMREALLRSAEKVIEEKLDTLKEGEARLDAQQKGRQGAPDGGLKPLVTVYEAMKPRDAARVFDKMDTRQLLPLARAMNPKKLAEVLGLMSPEAAEKLTAAILRQVPAETASAMPAPPPTAEPTPPARPPIEELPRLPKP